MKAISVVLLSFALFLSPLAWGGETWKIASLNWEPYSSDRMTTQGNAIQKLRHLLKQKDIELIVDFYPWERAQEIAQDPQYIGYFPAWPEEVKEGFTASAKIDWSWIAVLRKRSTMLEYSNARQLFAFYRGGLIRTYSYPTLIADQAKAQRHRTTLVANELALLKALMADQIDFAVTDPYVMTYLADKLGVDEIEVDKVLMRKALVLAIRNDEHAQERLQLLRDLLNH